MPGLHVHLDHLDGLVKTTISTRSVTLSSALRACGLHIDEILNRAWADAGSPTFDVDDGAGGTKRLTGWDARDYWIEQQTQEAPTDEEISGWDSLFTLIRETVEERQT